MTKSYGVSDSELSFISFINSYLKAIKITSFDDYQNYHDNFREEKKIKEESYDQEIKSNLEIINKNTYQIKQYEYDLKSINWHIRKKSLIIGKYWGKVRENIQKDINHLESKRKRLNKSIDDCKETIIEAKTKKDSLIIEKNTYLKDFDKDVNRLFELEKNEDFKNKRQGAIGERKLIGFITDCFDDSSYLINGVIFPIIGGAININNSTKLETQVDHIFVCSKGIFFIETKHWKIECTKDFEDKLLEQLEKIKRTISFIFKDQIDLDVIKIVLVGTERKINLKNNKDFVSLRIDEVEDYLINLVPVLSNDEIKLALDKLSPYLSSDKFPNFPRNSLKVNKLFIKVKNLITRRKLNRIKC